MTRELGRKIFDEIAIGITRAAEKESVAADALEKFAFAALFAFFAGGDAGFVREHFVVGFTEVDDELVPEFADGFAPAEFAFFDFVEFVFEARGKGDVENVFETFHQQDADAFAEHGGGETALILFDVFAIDNVEMIVA